MTDTTNSVSIEDAAGFDGSAEGWNDQVDALAEQAEGLIHRIFDSIDSEADQIIDHRPVEELDKLASKMQDHLDNVEIYQVDNDFDAEQVLFDIMDYSSALVQFCEVDIEDVDEMANADHLLEARREAVLDFFPSCPTARIDNYSLTGSEAAV